MLKTKEILRQLLSAYPGKVRWLTETQWQCVDHYLNNTKHPGGGCRAAITGGIFRATIKRAVEILSSDHPPSFQPTGFDSDPLVLRPDLYHALTRQQASAGRLRRAGWPTDEIAKALKMTEPSCRRLLGEARKRIIAAASDVPGIRPEILKNGNINPLNRQEHTNESREEYIQRAGPARIHTISLRHSLTRKTETKIARSKKIRGLCCEKCGKPIKGHSSWSMASCGYCRKKFVFCKGCGGRMEANIARFAHAEACSKKPTDAVG